MTQASAHRQRTVFFGAVLGLAASAMLFAALLFGCLYLRARELAAAPVPNAAPVLAGVAWGLSVAAILFARAKRGRWGGVLLAGCALAAEIAVLALLVAGGFASAGAYATLLSVTLSVFLVHAVVALVLRAPGTLAWTYLTGVWTLLTLVLVWR